MWSKVRGSEGSFWARQVVPARAREEEALKQYGIFRLAKLREHEATNLEVISILSIRPLCLPFHVIVKDCD
jgi:hypothetical protein